MLHKLERSIPILGRAEVVRQRAFSLRPVVWIPIPLLMVGFYFLLKGKIPREESPAIRASALALALTLGGYFFIYLITPYDIYWHLRFSLNRLLIQLWPSAIFLFFLRIGSEPLDFRSNHA